MFIQNSFIRKNTSYLKKKLKELGYRENTLDNENYSWLAANHGIFISVPEGFEHLYKSDIDCGENEELFIAIAALRDDIDKNQWFTDGENWIFCDISSFGRFWAINDIKINLDTIHKATVKELIKHFSK